jgi:hypothetical protein
MKSRTVRGSRDSKYDVPKQNDANNFYSSCRTVQERLDSESERPKRKSVSGSGNNKETEFQHTFGWELKALSIGRLPIDYVYNTNLIVFCLTQPELEPSIYRTWDEHARQYTTSTVVGHLKIKQSWIIHLEFDWFRDVCRMGIICAYSTFC